MRAIALLCLTTGCAATLSSQWCQDPAIASFYTGASCPMSKTEAYPGTILPPNYAQCGGFTQSRGTKHTEWYDGSGALVGVDIDSEDGAVEYGKAPSCTLKCEYSDTWAEWDLPTCE